METPVRQDGDPPACLTGTAATAGPPSASSRHSATAAAARSTPASRVAATPMAIETRTSDHKSQNSVLRSPPSPSAPTEAKRLPAPHPPNVVASPLSTSGSQPASNSGEPSLQPRASRCNPPDPNPLPRSAAVALTPLHGICSGSTHWISRQLARSLSQPAILKAEHSGPQSESRQSVCTYPPCFEDFSR